VHAVDGVSFEIGEGETFGLVGESGCGKTSTARQVLLVERPEPGMVTFAGTDLALLRRGDLRRHRRSVQAVFQDPYSSLNPRMRVRDILNEPMVVHGMYDRRRRKERVAELLRIVGLNPHTAELFPHQFSGGQRQRIAIARALALEPKLIVLDEPVSALDVSIRAQVLNLLREIQRHLGVSYLLIAHDLAIVAQTSHRVGVMYLGRMVETAESHELVAAPLHPYTKALFAAALPPDPRLSRSQPALEGEIPSPINPPTGCRFHTRCPSVMDRCREDPPVWKEVRPGHFAECHLY
jgi:oligopeptide/dipeptide ABC transporter ATP-binding protein